MADKTFDDLPQLFKDCLTSWNGGSGHFAGLPAENFDKWEAIMNMMGAPRKENTNHYYKHSRIISQGDHVHLTNLFYALEQMK